MSSPPSKIFNSLAALNDTDSQLAVELACEISPLEDILARHGLTPDELRTKLTTSPFRQMVLEAKRVWNSDLSVKERIRLKSMTLIEDSILGLYQIFHDQDIAPPARIDAFKTLSKVATTDAPDSAEAAGNRVSITFNIGSGKKPVTIEGVAEVTDDREAIPNGA